MNEYRHFYHTHFKTPQKHKCTIIAMRLITLLHCACVCVSYRKNTGLHAKSKISQVKAGTGGKKRNLKRQCAISMWHLVSLSQKNTAVLLRCGSLAEVMTASCCDSVTCYLSCKHAKSEDAGPANEGPLIKWGKDSPPQPLLNLKMCFLVDGRSRTHVPFDKNWKWTKFVSWKPHDIKLFTETTDWLKWNCKKWMKYNYSVF